MITVKCVKSKNSGIFGDHRETEERPTMCVPRERDTKLPPALSSSFQAV